MANVIDIVVPDGVSDATVVDIMQQTGAQIAEEDALIAVETDKATAEVPAPTAGKLMELTVKAGDTVSSGDVIGKLELVGDAETAASPVLSEKAELNSAQAVLEVSPAVSLVDIVIPDGVSAAAVVEVMQSAGSEVAEDDSLIAVETDKATAEVPAPAGGRILALTVKTGDTVSSGDIIGKLELAGSAVVAASVAVPSPAGPSTPVGEMDIVIPDGVSAAAVVEVMQSAGSEVAEDDSLIAVETDKATAEVPSPAGGRILALTVKTGDIVSSGDIIGKLELAGSAVVGSESESSLAQSSASKPESLPAAPVPTSVILTNGQSLGASVHATPSVRQFARELGVDLSRISKPSGPKGRITFNDVKVFIKSIMKDSSGVGSATVSGIPRIELPDFSKFGQTEEQPLSKIKQITGEHLGKGWLNIPLVTHFEEADITELESFRKELNNRPVVAKGDAPKTTALAFMVKAVVKVLQQYPQVNSSLGSDGKSLILKKYYNIGIAVDTPRGLLVPVIKDADKLSLDQVSSYIKDLGSKGRSGKLGPLDMEGSSFTISSLGSMGGANFTPLVNSPEAAILGVAKSAMKPIWNGKDFVPRLILPFSVSYDHRILDGGEVARFGTSLASYLNDLRYLFV